MSPTNAAISSPEIPSAARQITHGARNHILSNTGVWSPDGKWIVYDTRSDAAGTVFDGRTIEVVNVATGETRTLYESRNGANCGVAIFHPRQSKVGFILGPENPDDAWQYSAAHRQGVWVDAATPGIIRNIDARDIVSPFTPGALRGGSHVHVWHPDGEWLSFTYEDHILEQFKHGSATNDVSQRNVGVSIAGKPVHVGHAHTRNHDGECFTFLATRTTAAPRPGSDDIQRACEEGWIGTNGYVRSDGTRQRHALAFQGQVIAADSTPVVEVFVVDLPEVIESVSADAPLCGTAARAPFPPDGTTQRRLTFTAGRRFPGIQGARHWLRSSPDGNQIAFLMKDDAGVAQLWTISPNGAGLRQVTTNASPIASAFTWSPDGKAIAHVMDNTVCLTDLKTGRTRRITPCVDDATAPRPEACVFSPDGRRIAFVRTVPSPATPRNQIFVADVPH